MNKKITHSPSYSKMFKSCVKESNWFLDEYCYAVQTLLENEQNEFLRVHNLKDDLRGYQAFSVNADIRVVFQKTKDGYYFVAVGKHEVVYK